MAIGAMSSTLVLLATELDYIANPKFVLLHLFLDFGARFIRCVCKLNE